MRAFVLSTILDTVFYLILSKYYKVDISHLITFLMGGFSYFVYSLVSLYEGDKNT